MRRDVMRIPSKENELKWKLNLVRKNPSTGKLIRKTVLGGVVVSYDSQIYNDINDYLLSTIRQMQMDIEDVQINLIQHKQGIEQNMMAIEEILKYARGGTAL